MENDACSDTGPVLHLSEIGKSSLFRIFGTVYLTQQIREELVRHGIGKLGSNFRVERANKDQTAILMQKCGLDAGEASAIWLCKCLRINLLLTDDLSAREAANQLGLKPVGSTGIIMRSLREGILEREQAITALEELKGKSSLFITTALLNYAVDELKKFRKSR